MLEQPELQVSNMISKQLTAEELADAAEHGIVRIIFGIMMMATLGMPGRTG